MKVEKSSVRNPFPLPFAAYSKHAVIQVEPCPHTPISALSLTGSAVFIRNELVSGIYPCWQLPDASNLQFFFFNLF